MSRQIIILLKILGLGAKVLGLRPKNSIKMILILGFEAKNSLK